eukprot:scaffold18890_cov60-Phaeocystis_antarctica.AAC.4
MALGLADSPFWHLLARKAIACTALLAQTLLALVVRRGVGAGDVGECHADSRYRVYAGSQYRALTPHGTHRAVAGLAAMRRLHKESWAEDIVDHLITVRLVLVACCVAVEAGGPPEAVGCQQAIEHRRVECGAACAERGACPGQPKLRGATEERGAAEERGATASVAGQAGAARRLVAWPWPGGACQWGGSCSPPVSAEAASGGTAGEAATAGGAGSVSSVSSR